LRKTAITASCRDEFSAIGSIKDMVKSGCKNARLFFVGSLARVHP